MSQVAPSKDFTVAIVGGGPVGLSCAIGLIQAGVKVKLFEGATKFEEIGAAIGLGPNAVRALKGLGILEPVVNAVNITDSSTQTSLQFVKGTGTHDLLYELPDENPEDKTKLETTGFGIYRPTFIDALVPLIDPEDVSFVKRLTSTTLLESGQYRLSFADGTTYDADVVIGADGIKSSVRNSIIDPLDPSKGRAAFANRLIYRGIVPIDALRAQGVTGDVLTRLQCWVGAAKHVVSFPIKDRTLLSISATVNIKEPGAPFSPAVEGPWVEDAPQQELLDVYQADWGNDAMAIFNLMTEPKKWTLHSVYPPLESYVQNRIALIGDAASELQLRQPIAILTKIPFQAHAMVPFLGAGVGQGLEDAYALCLILSNPKVTKETLTAALASYDNIRRPRANLVLEKSIEAANNLESLASGGDDGTRRRIKEMYESQFIQGLWHHDLEAEVSDALERL